jgi:hypothetical protein
MFLFLLACAADPIDPALDDTGDTAVEVIDMDQDGSPADVDCDDDNPSVNPGAAEVCDGLDNDCDGGVDNQAVDASPFWTDQDGDGWGDGEPVLACTQPVNSAEQDGDCADLDPLVNPGAQEICDALDVDEDCDGDADDADDSVDSAGFSSFFDDVDGDGLGDATRLSLSCDAGSNQVGNDLDCDDDDDQVGEECAGWDGVYTGSFEMDVSVPGLSVRDTCSGTTQIEVVQGNKTQITGAVECSFSGELVTAVGADWEAVITGGFDSEDTALGDLELIGLTTATWEGEFASNTLTGLFSDSTTYEGYKVSYKGLFEVSR